MGPDNASGESRPVTNLRQAGQEEDARQLTGNLPVLYSRTVAPDLS